VYSSLVRDRFLNEYDEADQLPIRSRDRGLVLHVRAVEEEHMEMGMELEVGARALHHDDSATLPVARSLLPQPLTVEAEHRDHGDARHGSEQRAVVRETLSPREREGEHPLPQRHLGQHTLHEVGGGRGHAPAGARRAKSATLAGKGHKTPLVALLALEVGEASAEQAAVEVAVELLAHETGQRDRDRSVVHRSVERLEVVAHDLVERRSLGSAALVREAGGAGRDGLGGRGHGPCSATRAPTARAS
jgi:hypothetical protein